MKRPRFKIYQDKAGLWRWRLKAKNGRILADSGQGYRRKVDAHRGFAATLNQGDEAFWSDSGWQSEYSL